MRLACRDFLFVIMRPKTEPGSLDLPRLSFTVPLCAGGTLTRCARPSSHCANAAGAPQCGEAAAGDVTGTNGRR